MEILGLPAIRERWRSLGVTEDAVNALSKAWVPATMKSYRSKVKRFSAYCQSIGKSVAEATSVDIINWHASLLQARLKPKSVMGYVSAVVSMRTHLGIADDRALLHLTNQALRAQGAVPAGPRPVPSLTALWNHLKVLKERDPQSRIDARARAIILLRLATLARSYDLQYWLTESVKIDKDHAEVTAERTKGNPVSRRYTLPRVMAEDAFKRALCPVAALEHYLSLYKDLGSAKYLWRKVVQPFSNVKHDTIRSAVQKALTEAGYSSDVIKPHGLRGVGASLARKGGATLEAVKAAGGWRSWETMLNFYLHVGDFHTVVAEAIYDQFPDEASAVEES